MKPWFLFFYLLCCFIQMGIERFWAEFQPLLKFPMVVYNREPAVERTIDFVARFVTSLGIKHPDNEQKDDDTEDKNTVESNPLLQRLFDFLLEVSMLSVSSISNEYIYWMFQDKYLF